MSLSALGSQLAAINTSGKNVGFSLPSSRRHEESLGRGMHYSVQMGHSIANKSHMYKPSIIYEDARKASDVPLVTIRENCTSALRHLESLDPEFGSFVGMLCKDSNDQERGLMTASENDKLDQIIIDLLYRVALRMGNTGTNSKQTTTSCLHVLEYLLRRYDMHLRPSTAKEALLVLLPLHEEPYFLRLIQLVDLATIPEWNFLRPFADPMAKIARQVISKQASKDNALLRSICKLSQRNSKLPNHVQSLSFTASVIIEALTLQSQQFGSVVESACRTILPFIVAACRQSGCESYQNWGHIVASTVTEYSSLAANPRETLLVSILHGIESSTDIIQRNGLVVVLTALSKPLDDSKSNLYELRNLHSTASYGYAISIDLFESFLKFNSLPKLLGSLYMDDEIEQFSNLIASLLVVGWKYIQENAFSKMFTEAQTLLNGLLEDPKFKKMWNDETFNWVESYVYFMVVNTNFHQMTNESKAFAKDVFHSLKRMNEVSYENGLAAALIRSRRSDREVIASWFDLQKRDEEGAPDQDFIVLPPLVALEHADGHIRLKAIESILQAQKDSHHRKADGEGIDVFRSILRHFVEDEDTDVVRSAGSALCHFIESGQDFDPRELGMGALQALYRWTRSPDAASEDEQNIFKLSISLAACALETAAETDLLQSTFVRLVECMGAYLTCLDISISKQCSKAIQRLLGKKSKESKSLAETKGLLVSKAELLPLYRRNKNGVSRAEEDIRRSFMCNALDGFTFSLFSQGKATGNGNVDTMREEALQFCLWTITYATHTLNETETASLLNCLSALSEYISSSPKRMRKIVHELAGSGSESMNVSLKSQIKFVCDLAVADDGKATGLAALLEFAVDFSSTSPAAAKNLILVAVQYVDEDLQGSISHIAIVPALCLLCHVLESIRNEAFGLLTSVAKRLDPHANKRWGFLSEVCTYVKENKSSAIMGGSAFLSECLATVAKRPGNQSKMRETLLGLAASAACGMIAGDERKWIDICDAIGGHVMATTILKAAEDAGENVFPVDLRWRMGGKPILEGLYGMSDKVVPASGLPLIEHVVGLLKGIKMGDSFASLDGNKKMLIMSGPGARGGRARSYSVGTSEVLSYLKPYPKDMQDALLSILKDTRGSTVSNEIRNHLYRAVLGSPSWRSEVFLSLPKKVRTEVFAETIRLCVNGNCDLSEDILYVLPLHSVELASLLESSELAETSIIGISYLADYVAMNCVKLVHDVQLPSLFKGLLGRLPSLSTSKGNENVDVSDYARDAILSALLNLTEEVSRTSKMTDFQIEQTDLDLIVDLLSAKSEKVRVLKSLRGKKTAISLLASLCAAFPSIVTKKLIPAVEVIIGGGSLDMDTGVLIECVATLVTAYLKHASTVDLSPIDLFNSFIRAAVKHKDGGSRTKLYEGLVTILKEKEAGYDERSMTGAFVSLCLAIEYHICFIESGGRDKVSVLPQLVPVLLESCPVQTKISVMWTMLSYCNEILGKILGQNLSESNNDVVLLDDLIKSARDGLTSEKSGGGKRRSMPTFSQLYMAMCNLLMESMQEIVSSNSFRNYLKQLEGTDCASILRFWQDLIMIQNVCHNATSGVDRVQSAEFWDKTKVSTKEVLNTIQTYLPPPLFLAFATSLITEGGTEDLRSRATQLVADRSLSIEASSPEAGLFRDMLPLLVDLMNNSMNGKLLEQSLLVAVECIVRALCLGVEELVENSHMENIRSAISKSAALIENSLGGRDNQSLKFDGIPRSSRQVICSACLCASTCIQVCGLSSLPFLAKLMNPLAFLLSASNKYIGEDRSDTSEIFQAKMLQLSTLRAIGSAVEVLPQFVAGHMKELLEPFALPCSSLRAGTDDQGIVIKNVAQNLDEKIAGCIPPRLLIPIVTKSLLGNTYDERSLHVVLSLLRISIEKSKAAEVNSQTKALLNALTRTYDMYGKSPDREGVFGHANDVMLALILKLSEVELRSLYSDLRDWRGNVDKSSPNNLALRRSAFWSLSAMIGRKLRSIFLPCLSIVFSDVLDELELAVLGLVRRPDVKSSAGNKRQRLDQTGDISLSSESLESLQNLLHCLEVSLRADALNGGAWIRDGEHQRFESLLKKLGKLLHCHVPLDISSNTSYGIVVQGTEEQGGSVVGCIVALASAAGDEQLWKPLNHAVLQAASNETRSEVRKAGVMCLASLIRSIGEEYMVLIPESLPVLAELLEDEDEDIVGLAQECISLSEELLGESLHDSLR